MRSGRSGRRWGAVLAAVLVAAGCGEPAVDLVIPQRDGARVLDRADILDDDALVIALETVPGLDVVAVTYETEQASCGEAFRAGEAVVAAWDADIALVAVATPGDFESTAADRERCLGLQTRTATTVSRAVREEIAEQLVPPPAAENDWQAAFGAAVERLAAQDL